VSCGFSTTSIETGIDIVFPDYTVQTTEWNVENKGIRTDNTDKMFYSLDEDAFNEE
jgi:hypothetical protein